MTPYRTGASLYLQAGWAGVIPLPPRKKAAPPSGYTGWNGKDPSPKMIEMWCDETVGDYQAASNIAIHTPDGVVGVDVDHYNGKTGGATLAQLENELGKLPPTYISTSRDDGVSGIRWYRVEPGLRWPTGPGKDIEFIHKGHRNALVWPSIHPDTGDRYIWVDQHDGDEAPPPGEDQLAWLPDEWQLRFTGGEVRTEQPDYRAATEEERAQCLTEGEPCKATSNALAKYQDRVVAAARHDSMIQTVMALARLGEQGHRGVMEALKTMHGQFTADVAPDRRDGSEKSEFQRAVNGAIAKVTAKPTPDDKKGCCGEKQKIISGDRPRADVRNAAHAADWLREELGRGELAGIFRRDNILVHTPRMGEEGYLPPEDLGLIDAGPAQVRPIPTIGVKSLIETRYQCWRTTTVREGGESTEIEVAALFPQQSAQSACEAARLGEYAPNLKTLHGVTHTPMMRPDGTILDVPGYDAATGFLYLPDPDLIVPPIPDLPTPDQIRSAVELILTPVAEFPFVSEDDRATWIGLAFTPALRPVLPGPYQMGVITATNPGSGKTKLAKMITTLHGGVQHGEMPRDADELRKSITAALMDTTAPVVTFDNLTGVVRSSVLESLLTTNYWTDRWLGQNRSVTAANDRLWLATGNNAQFGGDLARRITTVALNPPEANHHLRTDFTIQDLDAWMLQHRGKLLAAILTIARGWVVAGRPIVAVRSDDYAPWVGGLRGMLGWAGFPGVFGGSSSEVALSSDDEEWHAFLVALHDAFSAELFTVKDLVGELRDPFLGGRIDAATLPGDLAEKWSHIRDGRDEGFRKSLGWWLKNRVGRYAAGWSVVAAEPDTKAKVARYAVKPPGHANEGKEPESAGDTPEERHAEESAGFRGFTGFDPATREREKQSFSNNGQGGAGRKPPKPRNPANRRQRRRHADVLAVRQGPDLARRTAVQYMQPVPASDESLRRRDDSMIVRTDALTLALLGLAERGERTHCSDPATHHLWLSEHEGERAVVVMLCRHCPVLTVCRDTAEVRQETWACGAARTSAADPEGRRPRDPGDRTDYAATLSGAIIAS